MLYTQTREAVGAFSSQEDLDNAISELESTIFARHDISVLGADREMRGKFGTENVRSEGLEDDPETPRSISVRPEEKVIAASALVGVLAYIGGCIGVAMVNPAPTFIVLAAIAGGSVIGALLGGAVAALIYQKVKDSADLHIRNGGLLLWVKTPDIESERIAKQVMEKHGGKHVHLHGGVH